MTLALLSILITEACHTSLSPNRAIVKRLWLAIIFALSTGSIDNVIHQFIDVMMCSGSAAIS